MWTGHTSIMHQVIIKRESNSITSSGGKVVTLQQLEQYLNQPHYSQKISFCLLQIQMEDLINCIPSIGNIGS